MKNINIVKKLIIGLGLLYTTPLWAAATAREDNSDLFVWIFLAFCALIIMAQLIPAIMVLMGFAKGVRKEKVQIAPEPVDDHPPVEL